MAFGDNNLTLLYSIKFPVIDILAESTGLEMFHSIQVLSTLISMNVTALCPHVHQGTMFPHASVYSTSTCLSAIYHRMPQCTLPSHVSASTWFIPLNLHMSLCNLPPHVLVHFASTQPTHALLHSASTHLSPFSLLIIKPHHHLQFQTNADIIT